MKVVGLDLSLTATGFCHPDGRTETLSSKQRGMDRIAELRQTIHNALFCTSRVNVPDLVAIEDYAFSRGGHAHEAGELGGVVKFMLRAMGQPYVLIGPSSLKKFATNVGNCDKTKMAVAAAKLGCEFADDNQCDAWWLRQMALYRYVGHVYENDQPPLGATALRTAYRDEAVGKIAWPTLGERECTSA